MPVKVTTAPMSVRPRVSAARLGGGVERLALQADGGHGTPAPFQPPVIGGKNAISRAPAIAVSALTWVRSMAARITFGFSNAWAYSSPRRPSHVDQIADGGDARRRLDLLLRLADALAHPGEIQKLHSVPIHVPIQRSQRQSDGRGADRSLIRCRTPARK